MASASCLRYCTDVAHRRTTQLCTMFGRLLNWYCIHTFLGFLPPDGILSAAKLTLRPSLACSCFGSVTARHWSSGRQPDFCGIVQVMELWMFRSSTFSTEGATYIQMAAITMGIGPHSSLFLVFIPLLFTARAMLALQELY